MRKKIRYIIGRTVAMIAITVAITAITTACSEDSLTVIDELNSTIYDSENTEKTTVDSRINAFYEKYGSKILYDFSSSDLFFGWSSNDVKWYVPVKQEGSETYIERMVSFLEDDALNEYPTAFTKKFLPYRIFLVDSVCDNKEYQKSKLTDVLELKTHGIVITHVSKDMDELDEDDWEGMKSSINTTLLNSIYAAVGVEPTDFNASSEVTFMIDLLEDPLGEFTDLEYSCYSATVINANPVYFDGILYYIMKPSTNEDFGYYVSFLMNTPKTKIDRVFERFPTVKRRAALAYQFMLERAETNLIEFQRSTCPDDPLPVDYFFK